MAGVVKKMLQKLPEHRIVTSINHLNPSSFEPPILQQPKFDCYNYLVNPDSSCSTEADFNPKHAFQIYPSFSFGHFLNSVSASGFCQSQSLEVQNSESEESKIMWADSVKKKRKRKMNKHKLRKLRKRLHGHS